MKPEITSRVLRFPKESRPPVVGQHHELLTSPAGWPAVPEGCECAAPPQYQKGHPSPEDQQLRAKLPAEAAIWRGSVSDRKFAHMNLTVCVWKLFFLEAAERAGFLSLDPVLLTSWAFISCVPPCYSHEDPTESLRPRVVSLHPPVHCCTFYRHLSPQSKMSP